MGVQAFEGGVISVARLRGVLCEGPQKAPHLHGAQRSGYNCRPARQAFTRHAIASTASDGDVNAAGREELPPDLPGSRLIRLWALLMPLCKAFGTFGASVTC